MSHSLARDFKKECERLLNMVGGEDQLTHAITVYGIVIILGGIPYRMKYYQDKKDLKIWEVDPEELKPENQELAFSIYFRSGMVTRFSNIELKNGLPVISAELIETTFNELKILEVLSS